MDVRLVCGDTLDILPTIPSESVDCVITDPPYGLEFMGNEWDHGVPGVQFWKECLRVAKPGAALLAFGGTRTHHRLMCAIEDAGWEIRDVYYVQIAPEAQPGPGALSVLVYDTASHEVVPFDGGREGIHVCEVEIVP